MEFNGLKKGKGLDIYTHALLPGPMDTHFLHQEGKGTPYGPFGTWYQRAIMVIKLNNKKFGCLDAFNGNGW